MTPMGSPLEVLQTSLALVGVRRDNELLDTSFGRVDAFNRRRNFVSYTNPRRGEPEYPPRCALADFCE